MVLLLAVVSFFQGLVMWAQYYQARDREESEC